MRLQYKFIYILLAGLLFASGIICTGCTDSTGNAAIEKTLSGDKLSRESISVTENTACMSTASRDSVTENAVMVPVSADSAGIASVEDLPAGETVDETELDHSDLSKYFTSSEITDDIFSRMEGKSFSSGCTLSRDDLRYLKVLYYGFDEKTYVGELVVNKAVAADVLSIMKTLYEGKYGISKMHLIDDYDADDEASMEDDNTSAFNYRCVPGTSKLSNHAAGCAIDINPFENPYVTSSGITPEGSDAFAYRESAKSNPRMIDHSDFCYRVFRAHGWTWGGDWDSSKDYQHFEIDPDDVVSDPEAVTLYPEVTAGTPEEAGIAQDSFDLIDSIIQSDVDNGFPGAQLAVIKDGKMIYSKAWGKIDAYNQDGSVNTGSPEATTDTLYDLASNTKMYSVNYAIQYLVSEGMLSTDTKISYILGEDFADDTIDLSYEKYENPGLETEKKWKDEITVRDLLCHQAGFPADPQYDKPVFDQAKQDYRTDVPNILYTGNDGSDETRNNTLKAIFKTPLMYEPGTDTLYSDVDYMLLGFVVEKVTGEELDKFCEDTFYKPMGLTHITFNPLQNGFSKNDCAATELNGNTRDGNISFDGIRTDTIQGEVHDEKAYYCMGGVSGHAGLFSNAEDLARLAYVMISGGYGNEEFFSSKVIDQFTAPADDSDTNFGLGWWRQGNNERERYFGSLAPSTTIGHEGWTGTLTMIDRKNDMVIVFLTNKLNTRITDPAKDINQFDGNWYTTASLGFVPQLIYQGMDDDAVSENTAYITSCAEKMQKKTKQAGITEDHPLMKAYLSLLDVLAQR